MLTKEWLEVSLAAGGGGGGGGGGGLCWDRFVAAGLDWTGETVGPDYTAELLLSYFPAFSLLACPQ